MSSIHWNSTSTAGQEDINTVLLSTTLSWKYPASFASHFNIYCVGLTRDPYSNDKIDKSARVFLGSAFITTYRVCNLPVPFSKDQKIDSVNFIIQPVTYSGFRAPIETCTEFKVQYTGSS